MTETLEAIRVLGVWKVLWFKTGYRPLMRFAHRHGWHHMEPFGPAVDGSTVYRCGWCGFNHRTKPIDYALLDPGLGWCPACREWHGDCTPKKMTASDAGAES